MAINGAGTAERDAPRVWSALDGFRIEVPSWGFANTGTRFGKFVQGGAATTIEEKFSDAAQVNALTGASPTVALHVLWDLPGGKADVPAIQGLEKKYGVKAGSINPNLFQDAEYKYGSIANPSGEIRGNALAHLLDSVEIGRELGSKDVSLWIADGSNYPGTQSICKRVGFIEEVLAVTHAELGEGQRMLVEYKPFEPPFYHTDIADWGMALHLARHAGPQAKVLVDTGHHYAAQNIEQIVAWLLSEETLGGLHFNDRRYADDDLTLGSIDPYQIFRIFHEIRFYEWESGTKPELAYMIDQSHIDKPKIEAMIQTVSVAQELYAKAAMGDHAELNRLQERNAQIDAEEILRDAFATDVRPVISEWRKKRDVPVSPLLAFRESGYEGRVAKERKERRAALGIVGSGSYA